MLKTLSRVTAASLIALLAAAASAEDAAPAETAPEAAPATEQLDMGTEVTEDAVGATYERETHGDWAVKCVKAPEGQTDPCSAYQLLKNEQGSNVAEITLFQLPEGGNAEAGATIITPLETLLTEQILLQIDDGQTKRYPFSFCTQIGCFARIGFTAEDIAAMKRGNEATLTIVALAAPDQKVNVPVSLKGFTAAYEAAGK